LHCTNGIDDELLAAYEALVAREGEEIEALADGCPDPDGSASGGATLTTTTDAQRTRRPPIFTISSWSCLMFLITFNVCGFLARVYIRCRLFQSFYFAFQRRPFLFAMFLP
jgi:hypothetical protein